jgi:hypothetical protein
MNHRVKYASDQETDYIYAIDQEIDSTFHEQMHVPLLLCPGSTYGLAPPPRTEQVLNTDHAKVKLERVSIMEESFCKYF